MTSESLPRTLAIVAAVVVTAVVVAGIVLMDSPTHQRMLKLDIRRVQDLQQIEFAVKAYERSEKKLPPDLSALAALPGVRVPATDPETGAGYEYSARGDTNFELCAIFATDTKEQANQNWYPGSQWPHGVGRTCFQRTVVNKS